MSLGYFEGLISFGSSLFSGTGQILQSGANLLGTLSQLAPLGQLGIGVYAVREQSALADKKLGLESRLAQDRQKMEEDVAKAQLDLMSMNQEFQEARNKIDLEMARQRAEVEKAGLERQKLLLEGQLTVNQMQQGVSSSQGTIAMSASVEPQKSENWGVWILLGSIGVAGVAGVAIWQAIKK